MSDNELFDIEDPDDFALPGDAARLAVLNDEPAVEEEPVAEAEPAAEAEEPAVEDRPRNPDGTFAAKNPEPAPLLGKFKSAEELAVAYTELERHLGDQRRELGQRRQSEEELAARLAAIEGHIATPRQQITGDMIDRDPAAATQLAYEQGDQAALATAFAAWKDEDPAGAAVWAATETAAQREQALRAEYEARLAQVEQRIAPAEQADLDRQYQGAFAQFARQHPDVEKFIPAMAQIAEANPTMQALIESGSPAQAADTFATLYKLAKYEQGDLAAAAVQDTARAVAEESQRAREEAFVASASTNTAGKAPSVAERIAAEWDKLDAPMRDGWNV